MAPKFTLLSAILGCFLFDGLHLCPIERKIYIRFLCIPSPIKAKFSLSWKINDFLFGVIITLRTLLGKYLSHLLDQLLLGSHVYGPPLPLTPRTVTRDALGRPPARPHPTPFTSPQTESREAASYRTSLGTLLSCCEVNTSHSSHADMALEHQPTRPGSFPRDESVWTYESLMFPAAPRSSA